ncbi:unnamed protein product, partial [Phaeothamnion confervicola]
MGSVKNNEVMLNWVTAKEDGFDHFEVEHAAVNLAFEKIGQLNGTGYSTDDEHAYTITDRNPINGINYYRLKSVDQDGSFEYSAIVSVVVEVSKSISVYPNPSNGDFVNVSSTFEVSENTVVTIYSQEGVILDNVHITEREARINFTNHLAAGVYILKYTS